MQLAVKEYEDLGLKNKIQVSNMNGLTVRSKPFRVCIIRIAISIQVKIKTTLNKQQKAGSNSKSNVSCTDQYLGARSSR